MKHKKHGKIFLWGCILAGILLMAYPTISDRWNSYHMSRAVSNVQEAAAELDEATRLAEFAAAEQYNSRICLRQDPYVPSDDDIKSYLSLLNINGDGIMGDVEIPGIGVDLPIYHGTEDKVLSIGAGHVAWTALPVGGEGTCCVISGHTGLPASRLFTELDEMKEGDEFFLNILGYRLTYEVKTIRVVEPEEVEYLLPEEGKDKCILMTCTPYGINTHRLLVEGERK